MRTFFVAGATGYTGLEVVRLLARRGDRVVAHVRPDSPSVERARARMSDDGAEVDVTPWDAAAMRDTLSRVRPGAVFGLLGTTRARGREAERRGGPAESYETVDYGLTVLLARAAVAAVPDTTFVYLSALGVTPSSSNPYYAARAKVEAELRSSGLACVIARPSFITGPDRGEERTGERLAAAAVDGLLAAARVVGARRFHDRYASIDAAGLARALVALVDARLPPAGAAPPAPAPAPAAVTVTVTVTAAVTVTEADELQRLAHGEDKT